MTGPMDGGLGGLIVPALIIYSCGPCIVGGIIGTGYSFFWWANAAVKGQDEIRLRYAKSMKLWSVSTIPFVGPAIALICMN